MLARFGVLISNFTFEKVEISKFMQWMQEIIIFSKKVNFYFFKEWKWRVDVHYYWLQTDTFSLSPASSSIITSISYLVSSIIGTTFLSRQSSQSYFLQGDNNMYMYNRRRQFPFFVSLQFLIFARKIKNKEQKNLS